MLSPRTIATIANVAIAAVDQIRCHKIHKFGKAVSQENTILIDLVNMKDREISYLISVLERNDVEVTEFDVIAYRNL